MSKIVIVSATRTAIGSFNGALAPLSAAELGSIVIKEAVKRAKLQPSDVCEVVLGQILSAGLGMGPARQAARGAGIPDDKTAYAVNQICGSGMRAIANGAMSIQSGDAKIIVAGGMESMSNSHHSAFLRNGIRMGNGTLIDTMVNDGLTDVFNKYHMGVTAENIADKYGITREMQDVFAVESQMKAEAAIKAGKFVDEIVPVVIASKKGDVTVAQDEYPASARRSKAWRS